MVLENKEKNELTEYLDLHYPILTEEDFYPIQDDRIHCCGIDDVPGGDTYFKYAEEFYELYEDDLFN